MMSAIKKEMFLFVQNSKWPPSWIYKMAAMKKMFLKISASKSPRTFILTAEPPFSGSRNLMIPLRDVFMHHSKHILQIFRNSLTKSRLTMYKF